VANIESRFPDEKSNVQNLHIAGSDKQVKFYNLDVIISAGLGLKAGADRVEGCLFGNRKCTGMST
jgi:hypothetical protein